MSFIGNQIGLSSSDGFITLNTGSTGFSFSFTTSYQEMSGLSTSFALQSITQNFTMTTDGRLKYTGVKTKPFMFDALLQLSSGGGINSAIQLYKNGSPVSGSESYQGSASHTHIAKFPVSMSTNDYVSLWAKRSSNASATIVQIILSAGSANGS